MDTSVLGANYANLSTQSISELSGAAGGFALTGIYQENVTLEAENFSLHRYDLEEAITLPNRVLERGNRYWVTITKSSTLANLNSLEYFTCVDRNPPRQQPPLQNLLYLAGTGGTGVWGNTFNALMIGLDLFVEINVDVNTSTLPSNVLTLSPNPVADQDVTVQFDFDAPTTGHITVYDETGRVRLHAGAP